MNPDLMRDSIEELPDLERQVELENIQFGDLVLGNITRDEMHFWIWVGVRIGHA